MEQKNTVSRRKNTEKSLKMRNRTELVANTGSDYDENEAEFEADDGSDDWKPDPEVSIFLELRSEKRLHALVLV